MHSKKINAPLELLKEISGHSLRSTHDTFTTLDKQTDIRSWSQVYTYTNLGAGGR